ncbi:HAD family hydrolase [Fictibacillus nanhaiensis]|uniref:HAD family hydrolase n=1 Tax=Fictibacillus nanhaiensis TaxID=742169 RepID=UPI002E24C627|nr:HAD family hydrolase [Fictibacillus nanhaiensis]
MKQNDKVFIHKTKESGKIKYLNDKEVGVEVIISEDKEQQTRTVKLVKVKPSEVSLYREKPKKYNPNEMFYMVQDFHKAFGHIVTDKPTPIPLEVALPRAIWTAEELVEFLYATVEGDVNQFVPTVDKFIEGINKAANKLVSKADPIEDVLVAQADALTDVEYFNQGSFVVAGVKPFPLFNIVQQANMGKLWENGKPRYREEDGKIAKPPHWEERFAPEGRLKKEIERQSRSL